MKQRHITSQLLVGALLVAVGIVLLLTTFSVFEIGWLLTYTPILLILLGIYALAVSGFRNIFAAGIVILSAGFWQLVTLDYLEAEQVWQLWPLLIVFIGLSIILGQYRSRNPTASDHPTTMALFGGVEMQSESKRFSGAALTAIFGGAELDLREAEITDPPAHISVITAFGAASLVLPANWNAQVDILPIFGATSDERLRNPDEDEEVDIVVTGFALFGAVSVE